MADKPHDTKHRYTEAEIDLVLECLIEKDTPMEAIGLLREIAENAEHDCREQAASFLEWMDGTKQRPKSRLLYDLRSTHYIRMLELLYEGKGIPKLVQIVTEGEDVNAQKAIEFLHNVTKGKPVQKVELEGFVTHQTVQAALKATASPDCEWTNPEELPEGDPDQLP